MPVIRDKVALGRVPKAWQWCSLIFGWPSAKLRDATTPAACSNHAVKKRQRVLHYHSP
ncbi:MAG TPA: hypothetical protein VKE94_01150 [Gemmataceae bacterium]|nr:hypothetical protein [Gemmataceae bacterium]